MGKQLPPVDPPETVFLARLAIDAPEKQPDRNSHPVDVLGLQEPTVHRDIQLSSHSVVLSVTPLARRGEVVLWILAEQSLVGRGDVVNLQVLPGSAHSAPRTLNREDLLSLVRPVGSLEVLLVVVRREVRAEEAQDGDLEKALFERVAGRALLHTWSASSSCARLPER